MFQICQKFKSGFVFVVIPVTRGSRYRQLLAARPDAAADSV
jgi:hypothetical protein